MYRLVLYVLVFLLLSALGLSIFGKLSFTPDALIESTLIILGASWITHIIFSRVFESPANVESVYITALILVFLITPPQGTDYASFLPLALWASILSQASKYIFAIRKKHIFNPAAFAIALTALAINQSATWWIGTLPMLPFVFFSGILVVRKIRRADLVWSFLAFTLATIITFALLRGSGLATTIQRAIVGTPLFFFAFIMLTEPLTTPPTKKLRIIYGALVGFLFSPAIHIGSLYSTPELALLVGNFFVYIVSPKEKLILTLKEIVRVANDTYDFIFTSERKFSFQPGQYMEWTLAHRDPDSRGNRRYFTLASSPTEKEVRVGMKFYPEPSSFKNKLAYFHPGETIVAAQLSGDFTLPKNKDEKLAFIAGGIGITPFRSMIQYLIDTKEARKITLLYSNKTLGDVAYRDIFDRAYTELGIETVYSITDGQVPLDDLQTRKGAIDSRVIAEEVPDYTERTFYLSGPHAMVTAFEKTLQEMGVSRNKIKTDFFPGFA